MVISWKANLCVSLVVASHHPEKFQGIVHQQPETCNNFNECIKWEDKLR